MRALTDRQQFYEPHVPCAIHVCHVHHLVGIKASSASPIFYSPCCTAKLTKKTYLNCAPWFISQNGAHCAPCCTNALILLPGGAQGACRQTHGTVHIKQFLELDWNYFPRYLVFPGLHQWNWFCNTRHMEDGDEKPHVIGIAKPVPL